MVRKINILYAEVNGAENQHFIDCLIAIIIHRFNSNDITLNLSHWSNVTVT